MTKESITMVQIDHALDLQENYRRFKIRLGDNETPTLFGVVDITLHKDNLNDHRDEDFFNVKSAIGRAVWAWFEKSEQAQKQFNENNGRLSLLDVSDEVHGKVDPNAEPGTLQHELYKEGIIDLHIDTHFVNYSPDHWSMNEDLIS